MPEASTAEYAIMDTDARVGEPIDLWTARAADLPHPISLSPGPGADAMAPIDHVAQAMEGLDEAVVRQSLHGNAARPYQLDHAAVATFVASRSTSHGL